MRLSDDFLSEIRYRNPIDDVISSYVDLKTSGNTLKGLCPFHNEKTPSFTVYPATASYYCFGCQNGGDVVTFIRQIENLDYVEAVKMLADRAGLSMPESGYDDSGEKLRKRILAINRETARFYHNSLKDKNIGAKGYRYFKERGLTDETIVRFGLGYAPDSGFALCNHLKKLGYTESELIIANVAGKSKSGRAYDRFRNKVMFPWIDLRGNVIAFGGRKMPDDDSSYGKYINTSDTPVYKKSRNMYALNFAKNAKTDTLILCEGYMDAIAMHQAGVTNAVACCGTAFTDEMASLLSRYAKEIVVMLDADEAGQKGTRRAIATLNKTGMKIRVLTIPSGKDPDEYIRQYGGERFKLLVEGAKSDIEYSLLAARKKYDTDTDDGKLRYIGDAVQILAALNNEIAENLYAGKLAEEFSISKSVILSQIAQQKRILKKSKEKKQFRDMIMPKGMRNDVNPEAKQHKRAAIAEEYILCLMMNDYELCKKAVSLIDENSFVTDFGKRVFLSVKSVFDSGKDFSLTLLGNEFSPAEMGKISQIYNSAFSGEDVLLSCIQTLKDEKEALGKIDTENMTDEQFGELFDKIGKNKK